MDIKGEFTIAAPRQQVWEALNDPEILKQCIPGCESIEQHSDTEFETRLLAKIGPVKAKFTASIVLSELIPPHSYTISGQGKGGPAGFGKGSARVVLEETPEGTLLSYNAELQVGGKLAQIGSRLVGGAAKKIAKNFFSTFVGLVAQNTDNS